MTIKTYKANTNISINVVLPSKKNMHISFVALSNGSSMFTTDNEEVQKAIERHYKFGKLFKLYSTEGCNTGKKNDVKTESNGTGKDIDPSHDEGTDSTASDEETKSDEPGEDKGEALRKVKVSDLAAAKDYLADTFGISRTSMRSTKTILEQAAAHGIEFEGLS